MLLIYIQKQTPRISYIFKHICIRILEIKVSFTSDIEKFNSYIGPKISYGNKPIEDELFFQSYGLLEQQGFEAMDITVRKWDDTYGFFAVSNNSTLRFDIFSASFYMLSRYEEYLPHVKDDHGRFMASESLAYKSGFLQQPVVDIWAYKLKDILLQRYPKMEFPLKKITIFPLIEAAQPYSYKQKGVFRTFVGYASSLLTGRFRNIGERTQVLLGLKRDPLDTFKWIINNARRNDMKMVVFFLLGDSRVFEESINTHREKFKMLIKYVSDYKEVGLIFSSGSLNNYEMLKKEKQWMEQITNRNVNSSVNSDFLVNLPDIYRHLVELEIKNDYTMIFRNTVGFRAGTCTPFLFYDLDYEIKTPLRIHPSAMTTYAFQKKYSSDILKTVNTLLNEVEKVNGTFSMIFSNKDFSASENNNIWRSVFSEKLHEYDSV